MTKLTALAAVKPMYGVRSRFYQLGRVEAPHPIILPCPRIMVKPARGNITPFLCTAGARSRQHFVRCGQRQVAEAFIKTVFWPVLICIAHCVSLA